MIMADNVSAYLTFEWGRSKPDEHKTFSPENVRDWLLSGDPIQMWSNNHEITIAGKIVLLQIHILESRIVRPEPPLGG
jgi:hypothetical protein